MELAILAGFVAGVVIMINSLSKKENKSLGSIAAAVCWGIAALAFTAPSSWKPGYIIALILAVCALYFGYPRAPK